MTDSDRQAANSVDRARRIEDVCDQAEADWKSGKPPRLEDLLAGVDGPERIPLLVELICLEVHFRKRRSEPASIRDYLERFPEVPPELIARALSANDTRRQRMQSLSEQASLSLKPGETLRVAAGRSSAPELSGTFGRYQILKTLGRGAMGVVYLARDTHLERNVALKVPQLSGPEHPDTIERFYREARAAAVLRHPHLCPVFDVGQIGDRHYISMAYIEGHTLARYINPARPQKGAAAAALIRKIALGIQEAHRHGIVHRDLKPGNIMVDSRGEPLVMDFGLARNVSSSDITRMTQAGMLVGTPAYMSPEQIEGDQEIGIATDIWSLGVILYELLTAQLPFPGNTIYKVLGNILNSEPRPLGELRPDLPPELVAICHRMISKNIADRFATMTEVAEALGHVHKSQLLAPPIPPPVGRDSALETVTLKLVDTVVDKRPEPALQQAAAYALRKLRLAHWLGGFAAICAFSIATLFVMRPVKKSGPKPLAESLQPAGSSNVTNEPAPTPPLATPPPPGETNPEIRLLPAQPSAEVQKPGEMPKFVEEPKIAELPKTTEPTPAEPKPRLQMDQLVGKNRAVGSLALTADGKTAFSAGIWPGIGSVVHKWDLESGEAVGEHLGEIDAIACDAHGERVLTGDKEGVVRLHDGSNLTPRNIFRLQTARIHKVAVSPDGHWGASVSQDHTLLLWNLEEQATQGSLPGAWDGETAQLAFSPDSQFIAATLDSELLLANAATQTIVRRIRCGAVTTSLDFSRDGTQLVSSYANGFVVIWNVDTGHLLKRFWVGGEPHSAQFHPDGEHLLVAGSDLTLHCLETKTGQGYVENRAEVGALQQFVIARDAPLLLLVHQQAISGETQLKTALLPASDPTKRTASYYIKPPKANSPQVEIVAWMLQMGGKIQVDSHEIKTGADLPIGIPQRIMVSLDRCPLLPGDLACLKGAVLDQLSLSHTPIEDKDLTQIATTLAQVKDLTIAHTSLGDETVKLVGPRIDTLNVACSEVTAAGLEKVIKRSDRLWKLHCDSRQFTPQVAAARQGQLGLLTLTTYADIPIKLAALGNTMPIGLALYGDPNAVAPSPCPDLSPLRDTKVFTSLHFHRLSFTPEDLRQLATHHQKAHICFNRCQVPPTAVDQLRTELPRCEIQWHP